MLSYRKCAQILLALVLALNGFAHPLMAQSTVAFTQTVPAYDEGDEVPSVLTPVAERAEAYKKQLKTFVVPSLKNISRECKKDLAAAIAARKKLDKDPHDMDAIADYELSLAKVVTVMMTHLDKFAQQEEATDESLKALGGSLKDARKVALEDLTKLIEKGKETVGRRDEAVASLDDWADKVLPKIKQGYKATPALDRLIASLQGHKMTANALGIIFTKKASYQAEYAKVLEQRMNDVEKCRARLGVLFDNARNHSTIMASIADLHTTTLPAVMVLGKLDDLGEDVKRVSIDMKDLGSTLDAVSKSALKFNLPSGSPDKSSISQTEIILESHRKERATEKSGAEEKAPASKTKTAPVVPTVTKVSAPINGVTMGHDGLNTTTVEALMEIDWDILSPAALTKESNDAK